MQFASTVTTKGQVVIPAQIRDILGINPFDRVMFGVNGRSIAIQKIPTTDEAYGFIKVSKKFSQKQIDRAISQAAVNDYLRH